MVHLVQVAVAGYHVVEALEAQAPHQQALLGQYLGQRHNAHCAGGRSRGGEVGQVGEVLWHSMQSGENDATRRVPA